MCYRIEIYVLKLVHLHQTQEIQLPGLGFILYILAKFSILPSRVFMTRLLKIPSCVEDCSHWSFWVNLGDKGGAPPELKPFLLFCLPMIPPRHLGCNFSNACCFLLVFSASSARSNKSFSNLSSFFN